MDSIIKAWNKTIENIDINNDDILKEMTTYINNDLSPEEIYEIIVNEYQNNINEILKITPGISTGLFDINDNIKVNTYDGTKSDIEDTLIDKNTVFDASSMTKLFTAILLLKEEEKGNIDLDKKYSDYSKDLQNINVPIIDALRFLVELKTEGRIDENNITEKEIEKRLNRTYINNQNTYKYSDIPYMLVPFLFGKTKDESTENYLNLFYDTYKKIGLKHTGYSTINMTGGRLINKEKQTIFDPKANIIETKLGYISGHAGVTTTIEDIEKLFIELKNGFLKEETIERLIENTNHNRSAAVYINKKDISITPIPKELSKKAFAISGSTGTFAVFDLESGFMTSLLANIKSTTRSKYINTGYIYRFGDNSVKIPKNFETKVIGGTGTIKDGRIINKDGKEITFFRATNNFKEIQIKTLIKLKFLKNYINYKENKTQKLRK
ncbi:MAG: beta-lactamase family protein [Bacilli bacterium]|nr:beta-lactamase family protein [Bacilli bacterium]